MSLSSVNVLGAAPAQYARSVSQALEASRVVKAGPGTVIMIKGYNSGADQFVQLHNTAALPADGAVPIAVQKAFGGDNFSFVIPVAGLPPNSTGIFICNSSTAATKTIGAADCWFEVYYI